MLGISVLQDALRTEHFLIVLAEKLNFLVFVGVTVLYAATLFGGSGGAGPRGWVHLSDWQGCEHGIIYGQVVCTHMMRYLVKGAFDDGMLVDLSETFEAKSVSAGEREGLLFGMVVLLEAHTTFKYRLHFIILIIEGVEIERDSSCLL